MIAKSFRFSNSVIITLFGLFCCLGAYAQSGNIGSASSPLVNGLGRPLGGYNVAVCNHPATGGYPCNNLATVYTDYTLTTILTGDNPTITNPQGNWGWWVTPGPAYDVEFWGTGITSTTQTISVSCAPSVACNVTSYNPSILNGFVFVDGVTYTTIQAAVTAACGKSPVSPVIVSPGIYSVTTQITDCDGLTISGGGYGTHVTSTGAATAIFNISHNNVDVSGFHFDCNNLASGIVAVNITGGANSRVHGNYIDNCFYGVEGHTGAITHSKIYDNIFNNANSWGIQFLTPNNSFDIEIYSNILYGNSASTLAADGNGISVDCGSCTIGQEVYDVSVFNNYVTNYLTAGVQGLAIAMARVVRGLSVKNNIVENSYEGVHVEDDTDSPSVGGNYAYNNQRAGVHILITPISARAVPRNGIESGNTAMLNGFNQVTHGDFGGVDCTGTGSCVGFTIDNNTAVANYADGIVVNTLTNGSFVGNEASGNNTNGLSNGTNYYILTPSNSLIVDHRGELPPNYIVAGLPSASSNPGLVVYVTDSTTVSAEGQTCVGSSTNKALAFSNGSVWKCF